MLDLDLHVLETILDRLTVLPADCESVNKLVLVLWSSRHLRRPLTLKAPSMEPRLRPSGEANISVGRSNDDPEGTGGSGGRRWVEDASVMMRPSRSRFSSNLEGRRLLLVFDSFRELALESMGGVRVGSSGTAPSSSGTSISPIVSIKSSSDPNSSSSSSPSDCCSLCLILERRLELRLDGIVFHVGVDDRPEGMNRELRCLGLAGHGGHRRRCERRCRDERPRSCEQLRASSQTPEYMRLALG